jgi:thioredoxin reductase (NADPH)
LDIRHTMSEERSSEYDIIIAGGGPAGLSAAVYAARSRRRTLLIERGVTGGQIALTSEVENYPGVETINGFELAQTMQRQAEKYGLEIAAGELQGIEQSGDRHSVRTDHGDYTAKAVILTAGADYNRLGVPGEERLTGHGVSYCATCDAAFFKDQTVAVVGGGDAAMDEGLFVTRYADKVYMIHRRDKLRASAILQERAFANPKMHFVWNTVVDEIIGDGAVTSLRSRNLVTGEFATLDVAAVFVFIGLTPNTGYLRGKVRMDEGGHIFVNEWMETEIPGLFAAGDVRANSARQVVTAAGDGATAAIRADHYVSERFGGTPGIGEWEANADAKENDPPGR